MLYPNTLCTDYIENKSTAASTAPCPTTALTSSKCHNSVKNKSKGRCVSLSLNIINTDACTCVNFGYVQCTKDNNSESRQTRVAFMCSASRLIVLYICVKFCENIERT